MDYESVFNQLNNLYLFYNPETDNLSPVTISCDYEIGLIKAINNFYPSVTRILCHFHFLQNQNRRLKRIFGQNFRRHTVGNYVFKLVSSTVFVAWTYELINEFFDHMEILALELNVQSKRIEYFNYLDYLRTYYFSDHNWTNVGNLFAELSSYGMRNFTNNASEAINKQFGKPFKDPPNTIENVLIRTKEFKKDYFFSFIVPFIRVM